ncbi:MAG: hypothetical protein IJI22_04710 [Bacilli bacterium]|nr:hypothetical protein [Bacilli bacterium]
MSYIILAIILFGILAGFLPPLICWLVYDVAFIAAIVCIIIILVEFIKNKKISAKIVYVVILIAFILFSKTPFVFIHNYSEVKKDLEKGSFTGKYKILNVRKEHVENSSGESYGGFDCDYVFDVKLNDDTGIVYQTSYCENGTFWTEYHVLNNYIYHYMAYYLDSYNKSNSTNLKFVDGDDLYGTDAFYISYHTDDIEQLYQFIDYFFSQTPALSYQFKIQDEDTNRFYFVSPNDDEYKHAIEMDRKYHNNY